MGRAPRDTTPYFIPGASGSVKVTTTASTSTSDAGRIGNPATNYYYLILATANNCPLGVSQRIGEFDFALAPGTLAGVAAVPATDATAQAARAVSLSEGTLADTQIASFTYDADGRRMAATVDGVTTIYPFELYEVAGTTVRKYYTLGGQRVAMRTAGALSYLFTDHLGSTSVSADASGVTTGELRYLPYGATRYTTGVIPTERRFTGQPRYATLGLDYFGARWYDSYLNRWIQPDTIVPDPVNPQSLNRYSFASNNPLRYVDSNGHCGPLTPVCLALLLGGMALLLQGDSPDLNVTPDDVASQRLGGALFVGGATLAGGSALAGAGGAAQAGTTAATAACADGDCTNEVHGAGQVVQSATQAMQSVWKLDPLKRGQVVERLLGRSPQLTQNFPVIDRFENGVATSIKSIDLGAKSYQNVGTLISTVKGYINDLAGWQGVRWGGVEIRPSQIAARELVLAISQGATQAQLAALQQLQKWASTVGVTVNVTVIP